MRVQVRVHVVYKKFHTDIFVHHSLSHSSSHSVTCQAETESETLCIIINIA